MTELAGAPLASEKMLMSSKLSFSGSAKRLWPKMVPPTRTGWTKALMASVATLVILLVWVGVLLWYVIGLALFGIIFFPFRLLTRSRRKHRIEAARHRELLQAMGPSQGRIAPQ